MNLIMAAYPLTTSSCGQIFWCMVNRTSLSRVVPYPFCSASNPTTLSIWSYFSFLSYTPHILKINRAANMSVSKNRISHMKFNSSRSHSELNPIQIIQTVSTSPTLFPPHDHERSQSWLHFTAAPGNKLPISFCLRVFVETKNKRTQGSVYCTYTVIYTHFMGMIRFTINIYTIFHFVHVVKSCKYKKYLLCNLDTLAEHHAKD